MFNIAYGSTPDSAAINLARRLVFQKNISVRLFQRGDNYTIGHNGNRYKVDIEARRDTFLWWETTNYQASVDIKCCCSCSCC